jgi:hypothetical protein
MAGLVLQRDVGSLGSLKRLSAAGTATAGGTGDATTVTGITINRAGGFPAASMPLSLALSIPYEAVLATSKTLSIGYAVQDSADGANWSDYQTGSSVVATGSTAASAVSGELEVSVNLTSARQYVRANHAPDLSATQTDTAATRAVGFFGGFDRLPA